MEKEQRVLDILKEMIAIDSETNTAKEVDMEKYLQKKLSSMGDMVKVSLMRVPNDPAGRSVVCGFIPGRKKDTVIFLNHHDVVGTEAYGILRDDAFSPDRLLQELIQFEKDESVLSDLKSGEWMVGRGSCDMKSGAAVMLAAALAMAPRIHDRDLVLHLYGGEERGCLGSFHMPEEEFRNIAAVVVGEPTGARPLAGHKGALWLRLSTSGRTSHASMPEEGDSALAKMLPAATRLLDFEAVGTHPFMGRGTSVLSTLHSGLNSNSVPDSAVLTMDIRSVPGMDHEKIRQEIREICGEGMAMETTLDIPPVWTDPEHPWMKRVYALYEKLSGRPAEVATVQFFTDAAALRTRLPEVPVVIFGPGDSSMAHQVDEACPVSQIEFMENICLELIRDWYSL